MKFSAIDYDDYVKQKLNATITYKWVCPKWLSNEICITDAPNITFTIADINENKFKFNILNSIKVKFYIY